MTTRQEPVRRSAPAPRAGMPVRALVVLALLVGLFGMHGLAADHSAAAPGASGAPLAAPGVTVGHHTSAQPPGGPVAAPTSDGHAAPSSPDEPSHGHPGDVAQACVAVLAGAALLALLLPGVHRALAPARPTLHRSVLRSRIPPLPALRPPDLAVLCVLRT